MCRLVVSAALHGRLNEVVAVLAYTPTTVRWVVRLFMVMVQPAGDYSLSGQSRRNTFLENAIHSSRPMPHLYEKKNETLRAGGEKGKKKSGGGEITPNLFLDGDCFCSS